MCSIIVLIKIEAMKLVLNCERSECFSLLLPNGSKQVLPLKKALQSNLYENEICGAIRLSLRNTEKNCQLSKKQPTQPLGTVVSLLGI